MKRLSLLFLLFVSLSCTLNAQFFQIAEGPVFDEPGPGYARILQMKNFSTMFLFFDSVKRVNVQVYDPEYRARTETNIEPAYGLLPNGKIEGIFEINGSGVVFISNRHENSITLFRLIIDGKTAQLKEEKQLAILKLSGKKENSKSGHGSDVGFYVKKDPDSENYAVAAINNFQSDTSKRIEIMLFDKENKQSKKAYYASATEKYKYLQYIDMAVIGDKVSAMIYGYNVGENDEKVGELILADINNGTGIISFNELLSFSNDLVVDKGISRFDALSKRIYLLITAGVKSDSGKIASFMNFIDPVGRKFISTIPVSAGDAVNKKYTEITKKEMYSGLPQNFSIDQNSGFTIVFEEMQPGKEKDTVSHFAVRNVAVVNYDNEGAVIASHYIPMDHDIVNAQLTAFNQANRQSIAQPFLRNNEYKTSTYISDGHKTHVLFNDLGSNEINAEKGAGNQLRNLKEADAVFFTLDKAIVPKREFVFGKPSKDVHNVGLFSVYDYDRANNIFVTLKAEREGPHPGIKLVWLQP